MKKILIDKNGTPYAWDNDVDEDAPIEEREVVAQESCLEIPRFQVLSSREGKLFNPYDSSININKKDQQQGGRFHFNLRQCTPLCYESYTAFLRSGNQTHLILSQRSLLDGP